MDLIEDFESKMASNYKLMHDLNSLVFSSDDPTECDIEKIKEIISNRVWMREHLNNYLMLKGTVSTESEKFKCILEFIDCFTNSLLNTINNKLAPDFESTKKINGRIKNANTQAF